MEAFKSMGDHPLLNMPPLESHYYMIDWLFDAGPLMSSSMGSSPLTYQEINAWADGMDLTPWERSTLKSLSMDYVVGTQQGQKKDCPPPYIENKVKEVRHNAIADSLLQWANGLAGNQKSTGLGSK